MALLTTVNGQTVVGRDSDLGDRCYVQIDPTWEYRNLWQHPQGQVLRFRYVDFEQGPEESVTPNYADTDVIARAEPYKAFVGLPSREINLNFTFMMQNGDPLSEVVFPARFLDALKYPVYDETQDLQFEPPPCVLKVGTLFFGRVILTGGDLAWKGPVDVDTLLPHQCEFNATFSVVRKQQPDLGYRFDGIWQ